jgi:hypothetical protein
MLAFLLLPMPHEISFTGGTLDLSKFAGIIALKHNRGCFAIILRAEGSNRIKAVHA